jgi:hypothetical protein
VNVITPFFDDCGGDLAFEADLQMAASILQREPSDGASVKALFDCE